MIYRTAQVLHTWSMEVFQFLVPAYFLGIEFIIIVTLFVSIRVGFSIEFLIAIFAFAIGLITFYGFMSTIHLASNVTELSVGYIVTLLSDKSNTKADKCFLISCRRLKVRIGSTFTVTAETFPTVFQDVIVGYLINLLVTFH